MVGAQALLFERSDIFSSFCFHHNRFALEQNKQARKGIVQFFSEIYLNRCLVNVCTEVTGCWISAVLLGSSVLSHCRQLWLEKKQRTWVAKELHAIVFLSSCADHEAHACTGWGVVCNSMIRYFFSVHA